MTGLRLFSEYSFGCWLVSLSYRLARTFRRPIFGKLMDRHRARLGLTTKAA